jgi:hypothetical protein
LKLNFTFGNKVNLDLILWHFENVDNNE